MKATYNTLLIFKRKLTSAERFTLRKLGLNVFPVCKEDKHSDTFSIYNAFRFAEYNFTKIKDILDSLKLPAILVNSDRSVDRYYVSTGRTPVKGVICSTRDEYHANYPVTYHNTEVYSISATGVIVFHKPTDNH